MKGVGKIRAKASRDYLGQWGQLTLQVEWRSVD